MNYQKSTTTLLILICFILSCILILMLLNIYQVKSSSIQVDKSIVNTSQNINEFTEWYMDSFEAK